VALLLLNPKSFSKRLVDSIRTVRAKIVSGSEVRVQYGELFRFAAKPALNLVNNGLYIAGILRLTELKVTVTRLRRRNPLRDGRQDKEVAQNPVVERMLLDSGIVGWSLGRMDHQPLRRKHGSAHHPILVAKCALTHPAHDVEHVP
jgi:hypothetical protein